jgi:hypothetical protein
MGLALCVFTWGLQYKLSLYDPPQSVSHKIPTAKLLSRDEQATSLETPLIGIAKLPAKIFQALLSTAFLSLLLPLSLLVTQTLRHREQEFSQPWRLRSSASLNAFFFRPPPVRIHLSTPRRNLKLQS